MKIKYQASMPANIALIKYMGRVNQTPLNASLSYTLTQHKSYVCIEALDDAPHAPDLWQALEGETLQPLHLSPAGQKRFLKHFQFLKQKWGIRGAYCVRSGNTFAADCGLASSASSFAALTQATYQLAQNEQKQVSAPELALLSAQGSGSSARSFFSPWCVWEAGRVYQPDGLRQTDGPEEAWQHECVVLSTKAKSVSSSEAHRRVMSSPYIKGRAERAQQRLQALLKALQHKHWRETFDICWNEWQDMHQLFESSTPAFSYRSPQTLEVLQRIQALWRDHGDGPVATLDAGPNVHLLYHPGCKVRL